MTGELAEMKTARDLLARNTAREAKAFKKMLPLARQKAEGEVLRSGLRRGSIGGAALLAGIPIYNALTDEPETELVNADEVIEPEVIEPELVNGSGADSLRYYARDVDPHWDNGRAITQGSDGTLYIGGQQFDDRDKAAAAAAGFDNVFDYKAARAGLSSREQVKALQQQLGLPADGLFGINTEKAYYDYMRSNPQEVADRYILPNDGWIQV